MNGIGILDILGVVCIVVAILGLCAVIATSLVVEIVLIVLGLILFAVGRGGLHL